ncbi:hypothetical protein Y032_0086g1975 [Ancylostoma ceylanicum]|uniref:TspO/MBR family protein n=1 Tax=Ancylostoma ceylanicum TaxID=53326 RepID=A0A016TP21_9BILA|nr:hypothetical protein Y032_0086g1975 [Ancylostoma ceylanicum]
MVHISQNVKKPSWAPTDVRLYSVMDILALSPLGYASYLVYKNGGGFDYTDTRLALGLYGANMALALTTIPLVKKKNLGCLWKNTALVHLTAAGAAFAFYKPCDWVECRLRGSFCYCRRLDRGDHENNYTLCLAYHSERCVHKTSDTFS